VTRLASALLALVLAFSTACGSDCETADPEREVRFTGGSRDTARGYYETSGWAGPFLHFPPGRRLVIEHGLGRPPLVQTYLSFSERGLADGNNASESAGNQLVIEAVDDQIVKVRNDSCAEFYLLLIATVAGSDAGASDASADVAAGD
jgi:hypothetical protein